jgi:hypothetical protein
MADSPPLSEYGSSTGVNALVGGVVSIVLAFLPFSTVLGGAIAGYLEGPETDAGLRVGVYAGLVAVVPLAFVGFLFGGALLAFAPMMGPRGGMVGAIGLVGFLFFGLLALLYTVGLSAVGGVLGAYLYREL